MYARTESPNDQRRVAFDRRNLATPPGLDCREGKTKTCVNQFQPFFLSELVLHHCYTEYKEDPAVGFGDQVPCCDCDCKAVLYKVGEAHCSVKIWISPEKQ